MANIIKSGSNKISVTGGLHARLASANMQKEMRKQVDLKDFPNRIAIICDFSGSMDEPSDRMAYSSNKTSRKKFDLLKEAVQDYSLRMDDLTTAIAVESFPEGFRINMTNDKNEAWSLIMGARVLGDTPMGTGMTNALSHHTPTRCVLISDGDATDGEASIEQARIFKNREVLCDCVHIGYSSSGETRLKQIAEITGGMFLKFKDSTTFAQNFYYLLPGEREAIAGMLPYDVQKLLGADEVK